ncbi:MAG TPA: hypothetical protein VHY80_18345 [Stellaceae bacterium]|jgi:hypothetical protein|nr:hypothetical protein [Stellaceae bacterium]
MSTEAAFPFFARRKRATTTAPRNLKATPRRTRFWRRSELTTFQKCLAVHMYYAAPHRAEK